MGIFSQFLEGEETSYLDTQMLKEVRLVFANKGGGDGLLEKE